MAPQGRRITTGRVHLYGPRRADGSWGPLVAKRWWARYGERVLKADLARAGKYLVVMSDSADGQRFLTLCREGLCRQLCGESENPGAPGEMTNFAAANYSSREEWEWRSGQIAEYTPRLLLREGSCAEQRRACPRTKRVVCGSDGREYDNACLAKVAGRLAAGSSWRLGGMGFTEGPCPR
jgi:hypothetical protein